MPPVPQRAENEFDPIPFDAEAARIHGRICAAVVGTGRKPRRRVAGPVIAATAVAEDLPLFTTDPDDFKGLETSRPSRRSRVPRFRTIDGRAPGHKGRQKSRRPPPAPRGRRNARPEP